MVDEFFGMDVNSREAELWSETMRLKSENEYLRSELQAIAAKAAFGKAQAVKARDAANSAVEYLLDTEVLAARALLAMNLHKHGDET